MFFHPLILGYLAIDLLIVVLFALNLRGALQIAVGWDRSSTAEQELARQRYVHAISRIGRISLAAWALSTVLFITVVAQLLPNFVPGAMCGAGVLKASDGTATRAALFRLVALLALAIWSSVDRISRDAPRSEHHLLVSKGFLMISPLVALGMFESLRMLWSLDVGKSVSCCRAVHNSASMGSITSRLTEAIGTNWQTIFIAGCSVLTLWAILTLIRNKPPLPQKLIWLYGIFSSLFSGLAVVIITQTLTAYYFDGAHHPCLWCLFLGKHNFIGYPIFITLFIIAGGGLSQAVTAELPQTRRRQQSVISLAAILVFGCVTLLPAILWRLEHGLWID